MANFLTNHIIQLVIVPINCRVQHHNVHHNAVRFNAAFLHLQHLVHSFLQPHRINSLVAALASGIVVHLGLQLLGSTHPQSPADGIPIVACSILPQQCPPWYTALLICCTRAALVGGIASIAHPLTVNRS